MKQSTGGKVSSNGITQEMIEAITAQVTAAVVAAMSAQVAAAVDGPADPAPVVVADDPPTPEPAEDPRIAAIRAITLPVTRRLHWITVSYRADTSRVQVNLYHTDKRYTPPAWGRQLHAQRIDLDDPDYLAYVRAACDLAADLDQKIGGLVDRLLAGPDHAQPWGLFAQAAQNGHGGRHD